MLPDQLNVFNASSHFQSQRETKGEGPAVYKQVHQQVESHSVASTAFEQC
jgi:hypothetical protein